MSGNNMYALTFQKEYVVTWTFLSSFLVPFIAFLIQLETVSQSKIELFISGTLKDEKNIFSE